MANSKLLTGSINLTRIKAELEKNQALAWKTQDGDMMLNISMWLHPEPDQKGNSVSMTIGKTKETTVHIGAGIKYFVKRDKQETVPNNDDFVNPF